MLEIGKDGDRPKTQITGKLPAAPKIPQYYSQWQSSYRSLGAPSRLEPLAGKATNVSPLEECTQAAQFLHDSFNTWLSAESFRSIREKWLEKLTPSDEVRVLLQTKDPQLQRLPWNLWDLLERYRQAEIALSVPIYEGITKPSFPKTKVKILAILGNSVGIDTKADRSLLERLPNTEISFLVEPQRQELTEQLWQQSWDILFFAGHTSSQHKDGKGRIFLNQTDSLTIDQLKYALKKAVARGLSIAIFNSCDGLGLAQDLVDLQIPQIIVMREPVPDPVAQAFLKYFLDAFAQGQSFYLAVREARERLQGLEDRFPCATWLPVIFQNPAEMPPNWQALCGRRKNGSVGSVERREESLSTAKDLNQKLSRLIVGSVLATSLVIGVRWLGILQPVELWAFDQLMRLRPDEGSDPRLLIVTITEADLQSQSQQQRQGSLSDASLSRLLEKLESYQPRAIGLDIYRDFPVSPNYPELATRLRQNEHLIATCKGRDPDSDPVGVASPPEVPDVRLGFSDFLEDNDGILRRHLLFMTPDPVSSCPAAYALNLQLAFRYLEGEGILLTFTPEGNLQLGSTVLPRLKNRTGGYQSVDTGGNQILLNYRSLSNLEKIAPQVSLTQVLNNQVHLQMVQDRIVLIGVTAASAGDYWATPYGAGSSAKIPGVLLQAHMISQILSAVLDNRPLLQVWNQWGEALWIGFWSLVGSLIALRLRRWDHLALGGGAAVLTLSGFCLFLLIQGWWLPLIPSILALSVAIQLSVILNR